MSLLGMHDIAKIMVLQFLLTIFAGRASYANRSKLPSVLSMQALESAARIS
jgi:hypothetical protein